VDLVEDIKLVKNKKHNIEIVVDRLSIRPGIEGRLADSLETVMKLSGGLVLVDVVDGQEMLFSQNFACPDCGISIEEITPRLFSFNNPYGACPTCMGLGVLMKLDPELLIPDKGKSLDEGAIEPWNFAVEGYYANSSIRSLADAYGFGTDVPVADLGEDIVNLLLYGTKATKAVPKRNIKFDGIIPLLERRYAQTQSEWIKAEIESYMTASLCPDCHGARLKKESLAVTIGGKSIAEVSDMSIREAGEFFAALQLTEREHMIADQILKEINARLGFLLNVGLDYLTLSRSATTLSGGEAQRIRLATQIGSGLVGVLYILDEPSIGLHQRDNGRLLDTLKNLRDLGNTVVVVEHDEETMYAADYIIDMGPGPGAHGGYVVATGTVDEIKACPESLTGQYLSGKKSIEIPQTRRCGNKWISIIGARENNLKDIDVDIPLGTFTCITGVSGSGKSTLVNEILYKQLARDLNGAHTYPGQHDAIKGEEYLDKVIDIDQSPIGRTPRSNPATYTGVFDIIRNVFAQTQEARMRGYKPGRFSFNVRGGRCEACHGDGVIKIEMHFMSDIYVPCEVCQGKRYNRETLEVKYKGKSIADVLDMTVEEALEFFKNIPRIQAKIQTLYDVGLGYMKLGQPATTLSGGEAQRVKLATELSRRATGKTLYILDEPTTGLHMADVHKLIDMLQRLVDAGNTVVVIEHNMDVIKSADYIIDLGPEGGDRGGEIVAQGTPEEVAENPRSYTGQFLKDLLAERMDATICS
jgi:excinuclease ABC subunit A